MKYRYKALESDNKTIREGTAEASDKFALARALKEENLALVSATEETDAHTGLARINISFGGIKLTEKITFAKNLAAMIDAGLALSRGLSVMERQTKSKKFKDTLIALNENVRRGATLSDALAAFDDIFPKLFVSMVRAGEESGKLSESLRVISDQMERDYQLRRKIRGAMMYPGIILSVMIIIGILMLIFVVPTLTDTFRELNVDLPASTRAVIAVSDAFKNHLVITLGGMVLVIAGLVAGLRTRKGKRILDTALLHTPIIRDIVKQTNAARTGRTLASLLSSGVPVVTALGITKEVLQNSHYKEVLARAENSIQKGLTVSSVIAEYEKLYPPMVGEMISVGEETGQLPGMLLQVATFFEGEVEQKTKDMSTVVEPFLMILIGTFVGFFALSMISPIYSLSSGI